METSEISQAPKRPSIVVGSIWLAVLCIGLFVYNVLRSEVGSDPAYATGYAMGSALIWAVIFHFVLARKRGTQFATVSFLLIVASVAAGSWIAFRAHDNREQMAKMRAGMQKEMEALAGAVKEAKPSGKIDTTPLAGGETGEMERFGRTYMSKMADLRNEYLRQLKVIGWDKALDGQRLAADKSLAQSRDIVRKAKALVGSHRDKVLATMDAARADIDKLPIGDKAKQGFRKGFEQSLETSRARVLEQLDLEERIVDEVGKMFALLSKKSGSWAIHNGQIVFSDQGALSTFRSHFAEIQKMTARQEALQKQAMDSSIAKLDKLGK